MKLARVTAKHWTSGGVRMTILREDGSGLVVDLTHQEAEDLALDLHQAKSGRVVMNPEHRGELVKR